MQITIEPPPMPPRECGGCTMCCKLLAIEEIKKPAGQWCTHCAIGEGCGIYETRPDPCRTFRCAWLDSPGMQDALRPNRSKVVFWSSKVPEEVAICTVDPGWPNAWRESLPQQVIRNILAQNAFCIVLCGAERMILHNNKAEVERMTQKVLALENGQLISEWQKL